MERRVTGFHQDAERHWVAELECGHGQHVRHDPPWQLRPWVTTSDGRAGHIGMTLDCKRCDRPPLLDDEFMTMHAAGTFEVKLVPQGTPDSAEGTVLARMSIDKTFEGELAGSSKGEMFASRTEANNSAAYVAMERVTGTLGGRSGSFVLMHHGTMTAEGQHLRVNVAPASGAGGLAGIDGMMEIRIVERKHFYEFEYTLPE